MSYIKTFQFWNSDKNVHYFVEIEKEETKAFQKWITEQTNGIGSTEIVKTFSRYK